MPIHEECGVIGVYDPSGDCARAAYYGLYAMQHRGQEACGIAAINNRELSFHKDVGLVGEVFSPLTLEELNGTMAVGHVRYSATGGTHRENVQPLTLKYPAISALIFPAKRNWLPVSIPVRRFGHKSGQIVWAF